MEIKEIFTEEDHNIHTPDPTYESSGDILKERMGVDNLSQEAQLLIVREVLLSKLKKKELGRARVPVERICALLDPRRKDCSAQHLVNGNVHLKTSAIDDVKNVAKTFVEPASSAAGDGGNGGTSGDGGAGGHGGGHGSIPPEPKKQKVSSDLEERRLKRLAKSKASNASSSPSPVTTVKRSAIIEKEMRRTWRKTLISRRTTSRSSSSGCVGASQVPAPRRVKSKQACRIWRSLLGYTTGLSLPVARRKGTFQPFPSLSAACAARSHPARWSD